MSLSSFVSIPDVRALIGPLRPPPPRKLGVPIRVAPRSTNYTIVGTAFDYFLRFEMMRRAPHAVCERWVAEAAPEIFNKRHPDMREVATRVRCVIDRAKEAVAEYAVMRSPKRADQAALAFHAIRLAKLDSVYRAAVLEPGFERADRRDVEDLIQLLALVPWHSLVHPRLMLLNPTFGQTSHIVGGADTDLITGDMLVDFKTSKKPEQQTRQLDCLLGYLLLARNQRRLSGTFPEIRRLGIYYARCGYLWSADASLWTARRGFKSIETRFFRRAREIFRRPPRVPSPRQERQSQG